MDIELASGRLVDNTPCIDAKGEPCGGTPAPLADSNGENWQSWSEEDKVSLAEIMIKRWSDFRDGTVRFFEDNNP